MKKNRKADDFLNFIKEKQKLDNLIELKKRQNLEKSFTPQDLQKFKYEVFEECGKLLQKMKEWTYEGSSKEDISQIFARLDKKDEDLNRLYEDSKQNYINEAINYCRRRIKNQDELYKKTVELMKQIKQE